MTSRRALLAPALLVALVLGACSDDEVDAQPYVDAAAAQLAAPSDEGSIALDEDEARCIAEAVVDVVGAERLDEAGITPEEFGSAGTFDALDREVDLPDDATERIGAAIDGCTNIAAIFAEVFSANLGIDASCVAEQADTEALSIAVAAGFVGEDDGSERIEATGQLFASAAPSCVEEVFLATSVAQGTMTQDAADCIAATLDDEVSQRVFSAATLGETPDAADAAVVEEAFTSCGAA